MTCPRSVFSASVLISTPGERHIATLCIDGECRIGGQLLLVVDVLELGPLIIVG